MTSLLRHVLRRFRVSRNLKRLRELARNSTLTPLRSLPSQIEGARIFIVGGSVRDFLLGGEAKDFDLCVTGATVQQVEAFLTSIPNAKVTFAGATFPVFKFRAAHDAPELDIALARTERSTGGGTLQDFTTLYDPSVTIEDDVSRRDFTWNALALDLASGDLVDAFDGVRDLKAGIIRTVGIPLERFSEDRTRVLRGLRFAAKFGFTIEAATWKAMLAFASKMNETDADGEYILKRELAGREFVKSLDANPVRTFELWDKSGLFDILMPEVSACKDVLQRPDFHPEGDVFVHTKLALASLPKQASLTVKLAVFFHDLGKVTKFQVFDRASKSQIEITKSPRDFCATDYNPKRHLIKNIDHEADSAVMADAIIRRLAMTASGIDADRVVYVVREHMFHGLLQWKLAKREKILFTKDGEPMWDMYEMACADACGSHNNLEYARTVKRYIEDLLALREEAAKQPPRIIDGTDIMRELNLKPGPEIKKLLEAVREKQLEELAANRPFTKEHALAFVRKLI